MSEFKLSNVNYYQNWSPNRLHFITDMQQVCYKGICEDCQAGQQTQADRLSVHSILSLTSNTIKNVIITFPRFDFESKCPRQT